MPALYACLRPSRRAGRADAFDVLLAVARDFSPRLHRYSRDCIVLDVAGLERLLGDPLTIGRELASQISRIANDGTRIADLNDGTRITRIPHGTRIADSFHGTRISRISDGTRIADLNDGTRITDSFHGTRISRISDGTRIADLNDGTRIADSFHGTRISRISDGTRIADLNDGTRIHESSTERGSTDPIYGTRVDADFRSADDNGARVAVAPTQIAAMLLSAANPGLTVVIDDVASALSKVPLDVLHQVTAEMQLGSTSPSSRGAVSRESSARSASLDRWGVTTLGALAALPAGALSARLGQAGVALQRLATGVDAGPLVPDPDVPRFLERIELEWPIDGLEPLAFVLARLLEPLSTALERADRGAAAIHLDLRLVDRTHHERMLQLPAAMRDPRVLRTLLVLDLESHPPHAAIDIITIEVDPAPGRVLQYSLLERARPSAETVATLMARLGALVGDTRCGQPALVDSDGPDAFEMRRFAPDESGSLDDLPPNQPSPRLRRSAEALRAQAEGGSHGVVNEELVASAFRRKDPDLPVLRRFRPPVAVRVVVERGRPRHVFIDRRGMPGGGVEQCAGPWRSSGAWWTASPISRIESDGTRMADQGAGATVSAWDRDEWDVALSDGSVCRLFQARDTAQWFLDGVMD